MKIKNALLLLLTAPYGGWPLWRRALEWIMWVLLHLTASDALWAVSSFFPAYGFLTGRIKKETGSGHTRSQKDTGYGGNLLRRGPLPGQQLPAVWNPVHHSGKGWVHNRLLHCHCPRTGAFIRKEMQSCGCGAVVLSLAGLYMLCMNGGELSVNKGTF